MPFSIDALGAVSLRSIVVQQPRGQERFLTPRLLGQASAPPAEQRDDFVFDLNLGEGSKLSGDSGHESDLPLSGLLSLSQDRE